MFGALLTNCFSSIGLVNCDSYSSSCSVGVLLVWEDRTSILATTVISSFSMSHGGSNDCASCAKCMNDWYWTCWMWFVFISIISSYWYKNSTSVPQAFQNIPQIKVQESWRAGQGFGGSVKLKYPSTFCLPTWYSDLLNLRL